MDLVDNEAFEEFEALPEGGALARAQAPDRRQAGVLAPDPASFGWPPTLALEVAMQFTTPKEVCEAYGISRAHWDRIRVNKVFRAEVAGCMEMLRQDGMAFKARAGLQALDLLKESWSLIHDKATPPNVRADLIKFTITAAGLNEGQKKSGNVFNSGGGGGGVTAAGFHININLG